MIIWGSGSGSMDLGEQEHKACPTCERDRAFRLQLRYRYAHLYFLRWVTEKKYYLACDVCQRGWELKATEVEAKLGKNPIPFMTRFGWVFLLSPFALFLGLLLLGMLMEAISGVRG